MIAVLIYLDADRDVMNKRAVVSLSAQQPALTMHIILLTAYRAALILSKA